MMMMMMMMIAMVRHNVTAIIGTTIASTGTDELVSSDEVIVGDTDTMK